MAFQIQLRRGTASEWTSANPTLAAGEFGYESDTSKLKIGDGLTAWSSLAYFTAGTSLGTMTGVDITAGDGLDISQSNTTSGNYTATVSADLKANGGIVVESTELAVDLGASSITGTLAASDGGTGLTAISTLLNSNTTKGDVGLGNVENTALSTWAGSGNITQVGTISSGTWGGTAIAYADVSGTPTLGTAAALDTGIGAGNVVVLNGSGALPAVDGSNLTNVSGTGGLANVVEDTTPQLGGNLDVQARTITTSTTNGSIVIDPPGTGFLQVEGTTNPGKVRLMCEAGSHGVGLKSPPHSASANYDLTLPTATGAANKALIATDSNGTLGWSSALGTAAAAATGDFEASGSITTHNAITTAHGISTFGSTLVDDADAAAARATLQAAASNHSHSIGQISGAGTAAAFDVGITSDDIIQVAAAGVTANEFLRLEPVGTKVISRTAAEVLTDIGAQATLTAPVTSPAMTGVSAGSITGIIQCSSSQYAAISRDPNTLYVIV